VINFDQGVDYSFGIAANRYHREMRRWELRLKTEAAALPVIVFRLFSIADSNGTGGREPGS
jgi:hypothetical protein